MTESEFRRNLRLIHDVDHLEPLFDTIHSDQKARES